MNCTECGVETPRNGPTQKYCPECSAVKNQERSKRHSHATGKRKYEESRAKWADAGALLSEMERIELHQYEPRMPKLIWRRQIEVDFSWAGSKNHIFSTARGGSHLYMRSEASYMRAHIKEKIIAAVAEQRIVQNKIWIDAFIQKPRQNGDAVNFVDLICDALKEALLVDDRWFSIWYWDWQIVKRAPKIFIGVGQESDADVQACSSCGRLLTFEKFQRNRATFHGIGRNCRECQKVKGSRGRGRKPKWLIYNEGVFA